jgi:predicted transcriptional regulator
MRTTITIDDHLLDEVRRRAAERRQTVSQVIEDSVREALVRQQESDRRPFVVHPVDAGETQPGVDLDDNAALLALMNGEA